MAYGVPCVVSQLLGDQLGITDGVEALIALDGVDFADKVVRLHEDAALWARIRKNALHFVLGGYDPVTMQERLMGWVAECVASVSARWGRRMSATANASLRGPVSDATSPLVGEEDSE